MGRPDAVHSAALGQRDRIGTGWEDHRAVGIGRGVKDRPGNVLRCGHFAAHGMLLLASHRLFRKAGLRVAKAAVRGDPRLRQVAEAGRGSRARHNHPRAEAELREFQRCGPGQRIHRRLAGAVDRQEWDRLKGLTGADVDDHASTSIAPASATVVAILSLSVTLAPTRAAARKPAACSPRDRASSPRHSIPARRHAPSVVA